MTPADFIRVSAKSACVGFLIGLGLALFVLCDWVHAETTCPTTLDVEAERCRSQGYREYHDDMLLYDPGPYRPNTLGPYEGDLFEKQANCYVQMEAAMRAMDEFVYREPPLTTTTEADLCVYSAVCRAARELDRVQRRTDALTQWERAKACWRKP